MKKAILTSITVFVAAMNLQAQIKPGIKPPVKPPVVNLEVTCSNFTAQKINTQFMGLKDGIEESPGVSYLTSVLTSFESYKNAYESNVIGDTSGSCQSENTNQNIINITNQFPDLKDLLKNVSIGNNDQFVQFLLSELNRSRQQAQNFYSEIADLRTQLSQCSLNSIQNWSTECTGDTGSIYNKLTRIGYGSSPGESQKAAADDLKQAGYPFSIQCKPSRQM